MKFKLFKTVLVCLVFFVHGLANAAESDSTSLEIGPAMGSYQWNDAWQLSGNGNGYLKFKAEGMLGMRVAFAIDRNDHATMYELVVGEDNYRTYFRNVKGGEPLVSVTGDSAKMTSGLASYWLMMDNGTLSFGKGDELGSEIILQWQDPNPYADTQWVGFSSWYAPISYQDIEVHSLNELATLKNAKQSSDHNPMQYAENAIDGEYLGGVLTTNHTNKDFQAWWQAELTEMRPIYNIDVYNRQDFYRHRLTDFYVLVSKVSFGDRSLAALLADTENVTYEHFPGQATQFTKFSFNGVLGKYVRVQHRLTEFMHLAEVEVNPEGNIIYGTNENETVSGFATDDILFGLGGDDILRGKSGSDTYHWGKGDGNDVIDDIYGVNPSNTTDKDTLIFGEGIVLSHLSWKQSGNDLVFTLNDDGETMTILNYFFADSYKIEALALSNGTAFELFDIQPTPIHSYSFSGNANDETGNANGTVYNATLTTDRFGNENRAYLFDGNDAIQAVFTSPATATFTAWATWDGLIDEMLFNAGANLKGPDLWINGQGKMTWNTWDDGNFFGNNADANFNDNLYHHFAVVNDADQNITSLYIDGEFLGTAAYRYNSNSPFTIGSANTGGNHGWTGKIDEVQIYNKALTKAEIQIVMRVHEYRTLKNVQFGICLAVQGDPLVDNTILGAITCDNTLTEQLWRYDATSKRLINKGGKCLASPPSNNGVTRIESCVVGLSLNQDFTWDQNEKVFVHQDESSKNHTFDASETNLVHSFQVHGGANQKWEWFDE